MHTNLNTAFKLNAPFNKGNDKRIEKANGVRLLPPKTKAIAKVLGINSSYIFAKLRAKKIADQVSFEIEEEKKKTTTAETQTAPLVCDVCLARDEKVFIHRGTQVYEKEKTTVSAQTDAEFFPDALVQLTSVMNADQLVAVKAFANTILATPPQSQTEIYKLRDHMMDVYNLAQRNRMDNMDSRDLMDTGRLSPILDRERVEGGRFAANVDRNRVDQGRFAAGFDRDRLGDRIEAGRFLPSADREAGRFPANNSRPFSSSVLNDFLDNSTIQRNLDILINRDRGDLHGDRRAPNLAINLRANDAEENFVRNDRFQPAFDTDQRRNADFAMDERRKLETRERELMLNQRGESQLRQMQTLQEEEERRLMEEEHARQQEIILREEEDMRRLAEEMERRQQEMRFEQDLRDFNRGANRGESPDRSTGRAGLHNAWKRGGPNRRSRGAWREPRGRGRGR